MKCKHDYHIIETWDTGYMQECTKCRDHIFYDANDYSGVYKMMAICFVIALIIEIIMEIYK